MRKILVIILFVTAGAFPQVELNAISVGYSSLGYTEVSDLNVRLETEVLIIGISPFRFKFRTSYENGEYDNVPISLGAPIVTIPATGLVLVSSGVRTVFVLFGIIPAFLVSGELGYRFLSYEFFKLGVFESHIFEWWLYKKQDKWHMDEAGWGQELGLEMKFPHGLLAGGAQFEITNKRKGIGWFARIKLIDLFRR